LKKLYVVQVILGLFEYFRFIGIYVILIQRNSRYLPVSNGEINSLLRQKEEKKYVYGTLGDAYVRRELLQQTYKNFFKNNCVFV
jgi:uncharacterized protein YehS (DUF1456 family)